MKVFYRLGRRPFEVAAPDQFTGFAANLCSKIAGRHAGLSEGRLAVRITEALTDQSCHPTNVLNLGDITSCREKAALPEERIRLGSGRSKSRGDVLIAAMHSAERLVHHLLAVMRGV